MLLFIFGSALGFYKASIIYMNRAQILSVLNFISIIMVLLLYIRQRGDDDDTCELCTVLKLRTEQVL